MQINEELLDMDGITKSKRGLLDLFIRRTAVLTSTPESLVEKIVKDQWANANKVSQQDTSISEIEFCNLGTLSISKTKARRYINNLEGAIKEIQDEGEPESARATQRKQGQIARMQEQIQSIRFKTKQI